MHRLFDSPLSASILCDSIRNSTIANERKEKIS
jgi:myo-inositol-1-phosphate synthase